MNPDRMPPLPDDQMDAAQKAAAAALIAGPRKAVKGPFIPLLRSPELMARLQKVGEYLRFNSAVPTRLGEFATLIVARQWTQHFEWFVHAPLALQTGAQHETIDALREGARPAAMSAEEALIYDFVAELTGNRGVCDETYRKAVTALGERGVIDLVGIVGYFTWLSMVLNVARTPPEPVSGVTALQPLPL
jgi:4-carboxymuconolactone decarboxylase